MRRLGFLSLLGLSACRPTPPPVAPAQPTVAPVVAVVPEAPTAVVAPEPPTPVAAPSPLEPLITALATGATPTMAALLGEDVTLTLATGEACVGKPACEKALAQALSDAKVQVLRRLRTGANTDVLVGLVLVANRRVPFAAAVTSADGHIVQVRLYGDTSAWRFVLPPPKTPAPPLTDEPIDAVTVPPTFNIAEMAGAFDPDTLAKDATGGDHIAAAFVYRDTASGAETNTALANQAAIRAFRAAFDVQESEVLARHGAGDWLVIERAVTLQQRAPVVPVPPTLELMRAATLEVLLIQDQKIVQAWGYTDPVAFLPAVEQSPIPPLH